MEPALIVIHFLYDISYCLDYRVFTSQNCQWKSTFTYQCFLIIMTSSLSACLCINSRHLLDKWFYIFLQSAILLFKQSYKTERECHWSKCALCEYTGTPFQYEHAPLSWNFILMITECHFFILKLYLRLLEATFEHIFQPRMCYGSKCPKKAHRKRMDGMLPTLAPDHLVLASRGHLLCHHLLQMR